MRELDFHIYCSYNEYRLLCSMSKARNHLLFIPTVFFLVVVLSGLTIPIHHIHSIEVAPSTSGNHHSDNHRHDAADAKSEAPSTYHEVHFVKLLSDDSFNALSRTAGISSIANSVVAILTSSIEFSALTISSIQSPQFQRSDTLPSGDKCVLFCSFLI
jgi:hypothetical protein